MADISTPQPDHEKDKQAATRSVAFIASLIFVVGLFASILLGQNVAHQNATDYTAQLDQQATALATSTAADIEAYNQLLLAGAAFANQTNHLSRDSWAKLYADMGIAQRFPNIVGYGYVTHLTPETVPDFEASIRSEGFPDFAVRPAEPRGDYTAITYIEPFNALNQKAFGFDMFSEPIRQTAMATARDDARITISEPVHLTQDIDNPAAKQGVLMYYPVYVDGTVPSTAPERTASLRGYVYIVIRPGDIVGSYIKKSPIFGLSSDVRLSDVTANTKPLYSLDKSTAALDQQTSVKKTFAVDDRTWELTITGRDSTLNRVIRPLSSIGLGALASLLLAVAIYLANMSRFQRIEQVYAREVQRSKDELLALASHQLRTPASGVKQYLGMLVQGFVGQLSPTQQDVAKKAYAANERQLAIINDLLYVSKADAGQLMIEPREVDLTALTRRVVDGFTEQAAHKNIRLVFQNKVPRDVVLDDRFGAMIIENLVSNAIKYSHPDTKVTVRLKDGGAMVELSVADQGVGIDEADMPRVFSKFERIENPLSHQEGGSGLGLFLARQLALAHGGDITVQSTPGEGSTFTFLIPKRSPTDSVLVNLKNNHRYQST